MPAQSHLDDDDDIAVMSRDLSIYRRETGDCQMSYHWSNWPPYWNTLRAQGRLQWSRLPISKQWRAILPELGIEIRANEMRELTVRLAPHIERLPRPVERVNGVEWPQPLPKSRNLLPKR